MSSRAYDLRTQIKTRLTAAVTGLVAAQIIIDRQHDILSAIANTVATASNGIAVTIQPMRGRAVDPDSEILYVDSTIIVSMWTSPVLAGALTDQPEEEIHEDIMQALHHFALAVHDTSARQCWQKLKVTGWEEVDDAEYLRRDTIIISEFQI